MSTSRPDADVSQHCLRTARVVRVEEQACEIWSEGELSWVRFAPMFPSPDWSVCPQVIWLLSRQRRRGRTSSCGGGTTLLSWVAGNVSGAPRTTDVDLDDVDALYTDNDLWPTVFGA